MDFEVPRKTEVNRGNPVGYLGNSEASEAKRGRGALEIALLLQQLQLQLQLRAHNSPFAEICQLVYTHLGFNLLQY
jgi:hypothetical protein